MRLKLSLTAIFALLAISLLPAACTETTHGDDWEDILWELRYYGSPDNMQTVLENTDITIEFLSADNELKGSGGCNSYFGGYTTGTDNSLQISSMGYTEMACMSPGVMEQEQKYFELLYAAGKIEVIDNELHITCGDEKLVYEK